MSGAKFRKICFCFLTVFTVVLAQGTCPVAFQQPEECPDLEELREFSQTSSSIESLYNKYVNLLTDARLTIDGFEPGVDLFFAGDLSKPVQKLKYFGNSITTFLEIGLHHVCREYGLTPDEFMYCIKQLNVTADYFEVCEQYNSVNCDAKNLNYQPIDGFCTNYDYPYRGAINTPYKRLLKNSYDDSIHEVKSSVNENNMPSSRLLSSGLRTLHVPIEFESEENRHNDLLLFVLGLVPYDIAKTLKAQTWAGNFGFECCECDGRTKIAQRFTNRHCMPIEIPERDPVFQGAKCMNYIRSMVTHDNCELKEASIINSVTHYLDLSFIYVSHNIKEAMKNGGKFRDDEESVHRTMIIGDERSSMTAQSYALVVIWIKFHNLVVDELTRLYPNLSDDVVFFEARRYVIAVYQSVLYNEVIPLVISARSMARYRIANKKPSFDPEVDPTVSAEFTSSAARVFHNFIQNDYVINFKNGSSINVLLRDLSKISGYEELSGVITGLLDRPWNTQDVANEPSNYLFTADGRPGLDLRAIDLQTERDFGIGTYCDALYYFNITDGQCIERFSDFDPHITDANIEFLKYAYAYPCDVDFGVGTSMHNSEDGDWLSEVADRVISIQFKNLKEGDPYFYTNALSEDQVNVVESITFKDILCYTIPDLPPLQPFVFVTPGENNTKEECSGFLNLEEWQLFVNPDASATNLPTLPPDENQEFFDPSESETAPSD